MNTFRHSGPLPKNVVAAPAYDDTGALVRQLPDNLRLGKEGLKADGDALLGIGGDADPDGGEGQVEAASGRSSARAMNSGERPLFSAVFWISVRS